MTISSPFRMPVRAMMFAGALASACLASAQETGSLLKHKAAQIDEIRTKAGARRTAEQFAACLVDRNPGRIAKLIDLPVDSAEYGKVVGATFSYTDECLSDGQLSFSRNILRGAVFQALYLRDFAKKPLPTFAPGASSNYRSLYPEQLSGEAHMAIGLEQFGECVALADPAGVRRLLETISGSGGEADAFQALAPRFSACIVAGQNLQFSKLILKGALAEGMYRLTRAQTTAKQGKADMIGPRGFHAQA